MDDLIEAIWRSWDGMGLRVKGHVGEGFTGSGQTGTQIMEARIAENFSQIYDSAGTPGTPGTPGMPGSPGTPGTPEIEFLTLIYERLFAARDMGWRAYL